tara:strand:- start:75 stop:389 length:315 start_codon:yes stop_codon:yes gene_type:complete
MNLTEFEILRKIYNKADSSQRKLSKELNISLGKINYCLNALKEKGYVKISNFKKSKTKSKYLYVLTPKGISEKTRITLIFMKNKMKEYDELKEELKKIPKNTKK